MTTILKQYEYRNERNNCTLFVELVWEKFSAVALWRVCYKYDSQMFGNKLRGGLLNKPNRTQINNYLNNL